MNAHTIPDLRYAMSREAIIGHETAWKVSSSALHSICMAMTRRCSRQSRRPP